MKNQLAKIKEPKINHLQLVKNYQRYFGNPIGGRNRVIRRKQTPTKALKTVPLSFPTDKVKPEKPAVNNKNVETKG